MNDVDEFDPTELNWKRVNVGNSIPPPARGAAAMASIGDDIYVYGGYDESGSLCFIITFFKESGLVIRSAVFHRRIFQ